MLIPRKIPSAAKVPVCMIVCALHGFAFGALYAPVQALLYKMSFGAALAWIAAGFPWDIMHGVYNFFLGALIVPLAAALSKFEEKYKNSVM